MRGSLSFRGFESGSHIFALSSSQSLSLQIKIKEHLSKCFVLKLISSLKSESNISSTHAFAFYAALPMHSNAKHRAMAPISYLMPNAQCLPHHKGHLMLSCRRKYATTLSIGLWYSCNENRGIKGSLTLAPSVAKFFKRWLVAGVSKSVGRLDRWSYRVVSAKSVRMRRSLGP